MPRSRPDDAERGIRELRHGSQNATPALSTTTNAHDVTNKDGSLQTALLLSLTETVKSLSDKVNSIQTAVSNWIGRPDRHYEDQTAKGTEYTLASATLSMPSTSTVRVRESAATEITDYSPQLDSQQLTPPPSTYQSYGFAADSLPFVETVSPAIR